MTLSENTLGPILKDVACDVVCPFFKDCCALIMFKTTKGKLNHKKKPKQNIKKPQKTKVRGNLNVYIYFIFLDSYKFFPMLANESFDVKKLPKQVRTMRP